MKKSLSVCDSNKKSVLVLNLKLIICYLKIILICLLKQGENDNDIENIIENKVTKGAYVIDTTFSAPIQSNVD